MYEGTTNTTITCESSSTYLDWVIEPSLTLTGGHDEIQFTLDGELDPSFREIFAIDNSQGAEIYTLVVLNATISPSDKATFPTAGIYWCTDHTTFDYMSQLVVIRKYKLPYLKKSLIYTYNIIVKTCGYFTDGHWTSMR